MVVVPTRKFSNLSFLQMMFVKDNLLANHINVCKITDSLVFTWEECTMSKSIMRALCMVVGFYCHSTSLAMLNTLLVGRGMCWFAEATSCCQQSSVLVSGELFDLLYKNDHENEDNPISTLCCVAKQILQWMGQRMRRHNVLSHSFRESCQYLWWEDVPHTMSMSSVLLKINQWLAANNSMQELFRKVWQ